MQVILSVVFVAALWLPLADNLFQICPDGNLMENRVMASVPELDRTWESFKTFPKRFEEYHKDHFGFRAQLTHGFGRVKYHGLGLSPTSNVIVGKEGWLYYVANKQMALYRGSLHYTPERLAEWKRMLETRRDWLAGKGVAYLFVVVPDKINIYPEYLPARIARIKARTLTDQLVAYLRENSDVRILDLRPQLLAEKARRRVYYLQDFHWNQTGAYVGYREIINRLRERFPQIEPPLEADGLDAREGMFQGDLWTMMALGENKLPVMNLTPWGGWNAKAVPYTLDERYPWPNYTPGFGPVAMERSDRTLRLLMFHTSMTFALRPYLSEHFARALYVFHTDGRVRVPERTSLRLLLEQEKPDIVIEERTEMNLTGRPSVPVLHVPELAAARFEGVFAASDQTLWRLDPADPMKNVRVLHDVTNPRGGDAWTFDAAGNDASMVLPAMRLAKGKAAMLKIDLTIPAATELQLFYLTRSGRHYSEDRSVRVALPKGRGVTYLTANASELTGRFRLDPGQVPGRYTIHSMEVRSVDSKPSGPPQ